MYLVKSFKLKKKEIKKSNRSITQCLVDFHLNFPDSPQEMNLLPL